MKIAVDRGKCAALGVCEGHAPAVFEIDEDGDMVILAEDVPEADAAAVREAIANCPTEALRLIP